MINCCPVKIFYIDFIYLHYYVYLLITIFQNNILETIFIIFNQQLVYNMKSGELKIRLRFTYYIYLAIKNNNYIDPL